MPKISALAPPVRAAFAERLARLRVEKGFTRARAFAKTLGIEENRYTRYERAEVEPDLTHLKKMWETLGVSPNELLGFPAPEAPAAANKPVDAQTWELAAAVTTLRQESGAPAKDGLAQLEETTRRYAALLRDLYNTVGEIVNDTAVMSANEARKEALAHLITNITDRAAKRHEK